MTEAEQERARIVAWLREGTGAGITFLYEPLVLKSGDDVRKRLSALGDADPRKLTIKGLASLLTIALAIERGEHLEGENG